MSGGLERGAKDQNVNFCSLFSVFYTCVSTSVFPGSFVYWEMEDLARQEPNLEEDNFMICHLKHPWVFLLSWLSWDFLCWETVLTAAYCFSYLLLLNIYLQFWINQFTYSEVVLFFLNLLNISKLPFRLDKMDLLTRCLIFLIHFQNFQN